MKYKTSELCRILNIGNKALRLYEEKGLILPKRDPSSNYRVYTEHDLLQIMMIRKHRAQGFSVAEIQQMASDHTLDDATESYDLTIENIDRQIALLQLARKYFLDARDNLNDNIAKIGMISSLYWDHEDTLLILDTNYLGDITVGSTIGSWTEDPARLDPFMILHTDQQNPNGTYKYSLGMTLKGTAIDHTPGAFPHPTGNALSFVLMAQDPFSLRPEDIASLEAALEERNLHMPEFIIFHINTQISENNSSVFLLRGLVFL